jgi:parallel beta-helix repeat protein
MYPLNLIRASAYLGAAVLIACGTAQAASHCVNPASSSGCMKTIGAALAAASPGDVVNVAAGTYKESLTINMPLSLVGADATKVVIDATGLGVGIYVDGIDNKNLSGVFISGFTVQNANFEGILVNNAAGITISGNIVQKNNLALTPSASGPTCPGIPDYDTSEGEDCGEGIHLNGAVHSVVANNTVQNNAGGILVSDDAGAAHDNVIAGNSVINNVMDCGVTLASHPPAAVTGSTSPLGVYSNAVVANQISGNGLGGNGAGAGLFTSVPGAATYANLILDNVITGNGLPGVAMHSHTPGQVLVSNLVIGNTISGNAADTQDAATPGTAGINVYGVSSITGTLIAQNTISQEAYGVVVHGPGAVNVQRNTFNGGIGVANLSGAAVNADSNWWGCNNNPTFPISGFAGCAGTSGSVFINIYSPAPIVK